MGSQAGEFESADRESNAVLGRDHPSGVDLETDELGARDDGAQSGCEFESGVGTCTVAEIDCQGTVGRCQGLDDQVVMDDPAVHPPQPVDPGGAPGDGAVGFGARGWRRSIPT